MALSWNEIKHRAIKFSKEWENTSNELADAKPFLIDFFNVFGIIQKKVASFEYRVKKLDEHDGYIDMLWKGTLLVEMKSRRKNLDKAYKQARDYLYGLEQFELPNYILVCDFEIFRLYNYETDAVIEFHLADLVSNVQHFGFIAGYQKREYKEQDPVNIKAAAIMGQLHDKLKAVGYEGHPLELYLVRLLFILFADDTTIFDKDIFIDFIEQKTSGDGSDLAARLSELFYILNTPKEKRLKNIDEQLNRFPYVNGKLFEEPLPPAAFDSEMRELLIKCCYLDWGKISPAIFGSMFQSAMNPIERRNLGAHYTSEKNILKLIKPLFLDELWKEFESVKGNQTRLVEFHNKLSRLKFLDPACGCGNFLVITYRELRLLELEIIKLLLFRHWKIRKEVAAEARMNIKQIVKIDIDQFFGIEYEEFPARIAEVAMWLIDHQMNMVISQEFGQYFARLPLQKSANITIGNALELDWNKLLATAPVNLSAKNTVVTLNEPDPEYKTVSIQTEYLTIIDKRQTQQTEHSIKPNFDFIFGNPPFIGSAYQNNVQKKDMEQLFSGFRSFGMLDYVCGWYKKAAQCIINTKTIAAFVSTNSITQGEQPGVLWSILFKEYNLKIHFAHKTFKWSNEAKGNAAVHVVIIGFAGFDVKNKSIFEYDNIKGEPHELKVKNINPYLVEGKDIVLNSISKPICPVPKMQSGSAARDGGFLILSNDEKNEIIKQEPTVNTYIRRFISGDDFINNKFRWCIWLKNIPPENFRSIKEFQKRFAEVKKFREKSTRSGTRKMASLPYLFAEERQPEKDFLIIPKVSSENRMYIPIAYMEKENIVSDKTFIVPDTSLYHFGVITSKMHMTWMKHTCGRLKSDFSYSNTIVYNNFPWPEAPNKHQIKAIEKASEKVLEVRSRFPNSNLADLYDQLSMPPELVKAHQILDKAVDLAYRPQPFPGEARRMEFLFELYEKYTAGLYKTEKPK